MKFVKFLFKATLLLGTLFFATGTASIAQEVDMISQRPPGEGPTKIEISFYLIDLMKVIDADETFEADIFFLARWQDSRLEGEQERILPISEIWTPNILVFNKRNVSIDLPDIVTVQPDGTVVYRQRLTGTFASQLDLHRFPFDTQTLRVILVNYGSDLEEVVLVESPEFAAARNPNLSIRDWTIGEASMTADYFQPIPGAQKLSRFIVELKTERLRNYYIIQMLIPLFLIVAMSWIPFWINPEIIPTRIGTSVTTVLTLIAYRFMFGSLVPKLPYLTLLDYLLFGATVLVAASLITLSIESKLIKDHPETVRRIDSIARYAHPAFFLFLMAGIFLWW